MAYRQEALLRGWSFWGGAAAVLHKTVAAPCRWL